MDIIFIVKLIFLIHLSSNLYYMYTISYLKINLFSCACKYISGTSIGRCNFEFDLCGWKQDENDDFDWHLRTSSTRKLGTGPATDHTLQEPSGHYIFIKNSFFQLSGQKSRISSPILSRKNKNCKVCEGVVVERMKNLISVLHEESTSKMIKDDY